MGVFCKMWKVIVFLGNFVANFSWFSTKHCKNRYFSTFFGATIYKKWHFWKLLSGPSWKLLSGPSWKLLSGPSWVRLKKRQLGPDNNFQFFCAHFFPQKMCWNLYFYSVFGNRCFRNKTNLDQIITSKRAKLGPDNNFTACIYIYMVGSGAAFLKKRAGSGST